MAHEITATDGVVTARGIRPWHGLGKTLDGILTPAQAIDAAGYACAEHVEGLVGRGWRPIAGTFCGRDCDLAAVQRAFDLAAEAHP